MNGRTNSSGTIINDLEIPLDPCTNLVAIGGFDKVELTWTDPKDKYATPEGEAMEDTDQLVSEWSHTIVVRKAGSQPQGPNDGTIVISSSIRNQYQSTPYVDTELVNDISYGYAVFAINTNGVASSGIFASAIPKSRPITYGIFGVQWDTSNSSTALTRLTIENDPNHLVDHDITTEPIPAIGTGIGSSPFDSFVPWMDMEEYNIVNSQVLYKQGDPGFSRSQYDTMVYIPEFWYYIEQVGNLVRYYISSDEQPGFEKHPGSGKYIAKYLTKESSNSSVSGGSGNPGYTRYQARETAKSKGPGWQLYDYSTWCAIGLLYLVEFADFNCQFKIGQGYVDTINILPNGHTDIMNYHTGKENANEKAQVQYRHIESLWGNMVVWIDGINVNNHTVYICTDSANYEDETLDNYIELGTYSGVNSGFIKTMDVKNPAPWAMVPSETGGSDSTYVSDYFSGYNSNWSGLLSGGMGSGSAGLWYFYLRDNINPSNNNYRLLWDPNKL